MNSPASAPSSDSLPRSAAAAERAAQALAPRPEFKGRTAPHSLDAERNLLSCAIAGGRESVTRCIAAKLTPGSFYDQNHGKVFAALLRLHARQDAIEIAVLTEELQQTEDLQAMGGYSFLFDITANIGTSAQLAYFLRIVREQWILREVLRATAKLTEACHGFDGNMVDMLSPHVTWFQNALSRVVHGERAGVSLRERCAEVKVELATRAAGKEDESRWIRTGMATFDKRCRPLGSDSEDHVTVIGGGSGHGKSALARQWAGEALKAGHTVVNYTRETSVKGWIRQLASNWARVDLRTLSEAPKDHAARLDAEVDRITSFADKSLFVFQQEPGCALETVEDVVSHARSWAWQHGSPGMMVVDYLQLFGTAKRMGSREQEVSYVSHTLQALQRELGCVMLVLAQLNETGLREMRQQKRDADGVLPHRLPCAGDFRESQAIYHDADRVVALYRPPEDCRGSDNYGPDVSTPEQWLVQIKRRYGGEGSAKCWFEKRHLNFREFGAIDHTAAETPRKQGPQDGPPKNPKSKAAFAGRV